MWNSQKFDRALKSLPGLYSSESVRAEDKTIYMHLFYGGCDWWVSEGDASEGVLFGFACLGDWDNAEWGYVSIEELKSLRTRSGEIDFDCHWTPCKFADIPAIKEHVRF
jgi:hypothetical protein